MPIDAIRRPLGPPLTVLLSLLALAALLQSTLFAIAGPSLLGWNPDHGHIFAGGEAHPHTHPWDHPGARAASDQPDGTNSGVIFTAGDDGAVGSVTTALTLPGSTVAPATTTPPVAPPVDEHRAPADVPAHVPSPPPRG